MKELSIPIQKNGNIVLTKNIYYDLRKRYKKIEYIYNVLDVSGETIKAYKHNPKNPCVIEYSNNKISLLEYWYKGVKHREYAPAVLMFDRKGKILKQEWYTNGTKLNDEEINDIIKLLDRRRKIIKIISKIKR
jgi:hypothetical protein